MQPAASVQACLTGDFLAPVFARYPLEVASAHGVWLTNTRGERVLDLYGGHAVAALGYGHPAWTAALAQQAQLRQSESRAGARAIRARRAAAGALRATAGHACV